MDRKIQRRQRAGDLVERLEQRSLLTASISMNFISNTLADATAARPLTGSATITVTNTGTEVMPSPYSIQLYISPVPVTSGAVNTKAHPAGNVYVRKALLPGASATYTIKGKLGHLDSLAPQTYGTYALFTDSQYRHLYQLGFYSAIPGASLTVLPPDIALNLTEKFTKLPASASSGDMTPGVAHVTILNGGSDPSHGKTTITVFATTDGIPADGFKVASVTKVPLTIGAHKPVTVSVPLQQIPANIPGGTYQLITEVIDPNGVKTDSPAGASIHVAAVPISTGTFTAVFSGLKTTTEFLNDFAQEQFTYTITLVFINTSGTTLYDPLDLGLVLSNLSTNSVPSGEISSAPYVLIAKPGKKVTTTISFQQTLQYPNNGLPLYTANMSVVMTDTNGATQTAAYPKKVFLI